MQAIHTTSNSVGGCILLDLFNDRSVINSVKSWANVHKGTAILVGHRMVVTQVNTEPATIKLLEDCLKEYLVGFNCYSLQQAKRDVTLEELIEDLQAAHNGIMEEIIENYEDWEKFNIIDLKDEMWAAQLAEQKAIHSEQSTPVAPARELVEDSADDAAMIDFGWGMEYDDPWYQESFPTPMTGNTTSGKPKVVGASAPKAPKVYVPPKPSYSYTSSYTTNGFTSNVVLKIPVNLLTELHYFILNIDNAEIAGFLTGNNLGGGVFEATGIHLSEQVVSGSTVDVAEEDTMTLNSRLAAGLEHKITEFADKPLIKGNPLAVATMYTQYLKTAETVICQWHSHVDMGVFQSGEDEGTLKALTNQYDNMIMLIMNKRKERRAWASQNFPLKVHNLDVTIEICDTPYVNRSVDEVRDLISKRVYSANEYHIPIKGRPDAGKIVKKIAPINNQKVTQRKDGVYVYPGGNTRRSPISPIGATKPRSTETNGINKSEDSWSRRCRKRFMSVFS